VRSQDEARHRLSGASDAERSVSTARGEEYGATHTGGPEAESAGALEAWGILPRDARASPRESPPLASALGAPYDLRRLTGDGPSTRPCGRGRKREVARSETARRNSRRTCTWPGTGTSWRQPWRMPGRSRRKGREGAREPRDLPPFPTSGTACLGDRHVGVTASTGDGKGSELVLGHGSLRR